MQEKKDKGDGQLQYEIKLYQFLQGIRKLFITQLESQSFTITVMKGTNFLWLSTYWTLH